MAQATRAEHMKWCKQRAKQEYEFYRGKGDLAEARRNAIASMLSDLGKHPETANQQQMAFMLSMTVRDEPSLLKFIDGFAE